jgi:signal transduction histidine kinase/ActR/RegA family two-component response regulator
MATTQTIRDSRDLTWDVLPLAAKVHVACVTVAGAAALIAFFPRALPQPFLFAALLAFACVTSAWKVNLPIPLSSGATLSVSYAACLTSLLLLGPEQAIVIAVAGVWTQCTYRVKRKYPLYRCVFNAAVAATTMAATAYVFAGLGGATAPFDSFGSAKPLVGALVTYFVVNTSLIAGVIAFSTGQTFVGTWRKDFLWVGASFMVAGGAGALAALIIAHGQHWKAALLSAPIYLTYRTYQIFVGRLDDQRRHTEEMNRLLAREQAARASAEEANRLKDEFLAIVSHELRTPLNAILGWADMLNRSAMTPTLRDRATRGIYDSSKRQAKLIEDLLDVARIASGKLRLERTLVDLHDIVRDAVQVVQPAADVKGIRIFVDTDAASGMVHGDAARLQQVATNLLSNATKFTPQGGSVHMRLRQDADHVELIVSDTGQGIAPAFLPSVFEPFRQADGSTTRAHAGLGLGLSIVRNLVDAHNGTVSAHSEGEGRGATFTVRLPVAEAPAQALATAPSAELAAQRLPSLEGISVLVVDDDDDSRDMLAAHLLGCRAEVLTADSAAHAFDALQRNHVDVLLADIGMPGEDGYSLLRRVRALNVPEVASIPAAAVTAFAREEDRQLALQAGFQLHLSKPIDPNALAAAVATLRKRVA